MNFDILDFIPRLLMTIAQPPISGVNSYATSAVFSWRLEQAMLMMILTMTMKAVRYRILGEL